MQGTEDLMSVFARIIADEVNVKEVVIDGVTHYKDESFAEKEKQFKEIYGE